MVSVRPSVDPAGMPSAPRSVSTIVAVASAIVLLTAGTACGSSSSRGLGAPNPSVPEATPRGNANLAAPAPSEPAGATVLADPTQYAQWIERLVEGKEQLGPLEGGDGQAISASCDPSSVSNPDTSHTTTSCQITYADGSVWQQTVTVTFNSQGNPVAASANAGTELSPPTGGSSSGGST
jgi:hypothetical protein